MAVEEVDRVAVQRDAALVHAMATRTLPPDDVDIHDPIVAYLAAWVDWVDAGVDEDEPAFDLTMGKDRVMNGKDRASMGKDRVVSLQGRRHRRAALIAGSTIAALVVSSGAAAAMTGDPFLVAKAPLKVIEKVNPFDNSSDDDETDQNAREDLPPTASDVAEANKLLADARRAAAHGDVEKAQRLVDKANALLGGHANPGQQHRIDKLVDDIASGKPGQGVDNG